MFYNICDANMTERKDDFSKSYSNEYEARFILNLYSAFLSVYHSYKAMSVVILTPYNEQKNLVGVIERVDG